MREVPATDFGRPVSEIASDAATIIFIDQAVVISQKYLFSQYLAVDEQDTANQKNQQNPIGKD
jgi:hypothetical protein